MQKTVADKVSSILPSQLAGIIHTFMQSAMNIIAGLCQNIEVAANKIADLETERKIEHDNARNNFSILTRLQNINESLFGCPNILQAMMTIEKGFQEKFRDDTDTVDFRVLFGPSTDSKNTRTTNPLANVIIDTILRGFEKDLKNK